MIVEEVVLWLNKMAHHAQYLEVKNVLNEAARQLTYQKRSLATVLKANESMAKQCAEWIEADKKNCLYAFPCVPGDEVYVIAKCGDIRPVPDGDVFGPLDAPNAATGYYCPFDHDGCPHVGVDCCDVESTPAVFKDVVLSIEVLQEGEIYIGLEKLGIFTLSDFGATVFTDKKQAESKLEEM